MIRLSDIHKSFGEQKVLQGVDLNILEGSITVIIGGSGEGKSVLLKTIIGLMEPEQGQILLGGTDLLKLSKVKQMEMRRRFGFLFQNAALFDSMNVYDNIAFPMREHSDATEAEIRQKVVEVLAQVGLKGVEAKMPAELSGGMRKRVGLARALILGPEVMLYDEPTTGLDPILSDSIDRLIVETQQSRNMTTLVVSHDISATFKIADQVAMLHDGKILEQGSPKEFRQSTLPYVRRFLEGKAEKGYIG